MLSTEVTCFLEPQICGLGIYFPYLCALPRSPWLLGRAKAALYSLWALWLVSVCAERIGKHFSIPTNYLAEQC